MSPTDETREDLYRQINIRLRQLSSHDLVAVADVVNAIISRDQEVVSAELEILAEEGVSLNAMRALANRQSH
ncbi:MAG: hypothetical protein AAFW01_15200 [Pseudomonadota bacterium]